MRKPSISVFLAAFIVVLAGGVALAQVGTMTFDSDEQAPPAALAMPGGDEDAAPDPEVKTTTTTTKAPADPKPRADRVEKAEQDEPAKEEVAEPDKPESEDVTPPDFAVLSPANGAEVEQKVVVFEGYVEPDATVTRGKYAAKVDGETWRLELVLSPGKNHVTFVATDAAGNQSKASVTVHLAGQAEDPKDEKPKEEKPTTKEFSANQKFGSCGEDVPYDKFWGTGVPGDTVSVVSPYGSGSTEVGKDGHWALKVHFPDAPVGEPFAVVVEGSNGRAEFTFVNTGNAKGDDKG